MAEAGRPEKYKEEYNQLAYNYCLMGATDKDLAKFFNVCEATINNWKLEKDGFLESINEGKHIADSKVALSLYNRAVGYSCKETKLAQDQGKFTDSVDIIKHYPPDPTSMIFWLKNRQPSKFRDKQKDDDNSSLIEGFKDIAKALNSGKE